MDSKHTVIVICGPTAAGKTSLAIDLARHFNTAIISADSRQCYREMTIGVAKPPAEALAEINHYFINSHSVHEEVNAVVFEQYALKAASEIFEHNPVSIMVGGTGLYIKAFVEGLDDIPAVDEEIRRQVNSEYRSNGLAWLQQQVQRTDPGFWQVAEQRNPHRLLRALEVSRSTGKSVLSFRKGAKAQRPFNVVQFGLELPKEELHQNINSRVDEMMEQGLLQEVTTLFPVRHLKALQTVGYRELFEHLEGKTSRDVAINNLKTNTRRYAKRQLTWFKKDQRIEWITAGESGFSAILNRLNT